ncbi:MAG: RsmE family RNA methyltransferase [Candidatus Taylorbacteria bacterium]|nr:RsmE family RNA methyltransferase [Candidatus Taylorbacteria bacterium]
MRLHRFFVNEKLGVTEAITIKDHGLANQLGRVFRLKKGDEVVLFDGSGNDFTCIISELKEDAVDFNIIESVKSRYMPARDIYLCASIVKKDNFEWIVEKATELGVTHIIPVISERSEKKSLNEERLKKIALEASEQSGRGNVPTIHGIISLNELINSSASSIPANTKLIAFHTEGVSEYGELHISDICKDESMAVFIGPEGGWSPDEIKLFQANNIPILCLGNQVLRAETAVVAILSQVVFKN